MLNLTHRAIIGLITLLFSNTMFAAGPDYIRKEKPVGDTMDDAEGLITEGFDEKKFDFSLFPALDRRLENLPAFWSDTRIAFKPRSYYFNRDRDSGDSVAWALGGALAYQSGHWKKRVQIAATVHTSQKLYGPGDKDGTLLLQPGQQSFSVLGEAYVNFQLSENIELRGGRTTVDLPYLNRQDNRMVPNSFFGYGLGGTLWDSAEFFTAHITHMKRRNSDNFEPMSKAAGLHGTDEPATVAGMRYSWTSSLNLGFLNIYAWDFMNTFFTEGNFAYQLSDELALGISAQYTDQRSIGDELDGDFETSVFTTRVNVTWLGITPSAAYSSTDNNSRIRSPFGSYPGYLSLMVKDFNRAGEDAWLVGLAYDFTDIGLKGISGFTNYAEGEAPGAPDQKELNLTLDIRPTQALWDGLWLSLRHARVNQSGTGADDIRDWRIILNYEIPLL